MKIGRHRGKNDDRQCKLCGDECEVKFLGLIPVRTNEIAGFVIITFWNAITE